MKFPLFLTILGLFSLLAVPNFAEETDETFCRAGCQQENPNTNNECRECCTHYPCIYYYWYDCDQDACWPGKREDSFYDHFTR